MSQEECPTCHGTEIVTHNSIGVAVCWTCNTDTPVTCTCPIMGGLTHYRYGGICPPLPDPDLPLDEYGVQAGWWTT